MIKNSNLPKGSVVNI